jgi:hypothetical protein
MSEEIERLKCCLGMKWPDLPCVVILCELLGGMTGMDFGGGHRWAGGEMGLGECDLGVEHEADCVGLGEAGLAVSGLVGAVGGDGGLVGAPGGDRVRVDAPGGAGG